MDVHSRHGDAGVTVLRTVGYCCRFSLSWALMLSTSIGKIKAAVAMKSFRRYLALPDFVILRTRCCISGTNGDIQECIRPPNSVSIASQALFIHPGG